jgi:hypothetical protein
MKFERLTFARESGGLETALVPQTFMNHLEQPSQLARHSSDCVPGN